MPFKRILIETSPRCSFLFVKGPIPSLKGRWVNLLFCCTPCLYLNLPALIYQAFITSEHLSGVVITVVMMSQLLCWLSCFSSSIVILQPTDAPRSYSLVAMRSTGMNDKCEYMSNGFYWHLITSCFNIYSNEFLFLLFYLPCKYYQSSMLPSANNWQGYSTEMPKIKGLKPSRIYIYR